MFVYSVPRCACWCVKAEEVQQVDCVCVECTRCVLQAEVQVDTHQVEHTSG